MRARKTLTRTEGTKETRAVKLSEPRIEIIRWLGKGCYIYLDERGKWRMSAHEKHDGTFESAKSGHTNNLSYAPASAGTHLSRPTVEFLIEERIVLGYIDDDNKIRYRLNDNEDFKYWKQIKMAIVEGALGVTRKMKK